MDKINKISFSNYTESKYVQPLRMHYTQDGVQKTWDLVKVHASVAILIFNITRKKFVFVKQFRPPVFYSSIPLEDRKDNIDVKKYSGQLGITIELCAGVVDKEKTLEEIAQEEVLEECGYNVPLSNLQRVIAFKSGVGIAGDRQTLYFAEVTDDMRISSGGGLVAEGELIEVVEMSMSEVQDYIHQDEVCSPAGLLFALNWFINTMASKYK